ncbi:DUF6318 family protein [Blastococcus sp. SYSU DS0533]
MRDLRGGLIRTTLGCLLAGTVLLTGCAEKQEASTSLPTTEAAPTTESLPPLGPADMPMPKEARTQDAAGAEAFVRYYVNLINRTSTVMDAEPLRRLSDGCRDCDRIASGTEEAASAGQDYEGGELTIVEVGAPVMKNGAADFPIVVDQAEFVVLDASGKPTHGGSAAYFNVTGGVAVVWDSTRQSWLMRDLTFG